MDSPGRRRLAILVVPLIIGLVLARQAVPRVQVVDFVLVFASGVLFGVCLLRLIQLVRQGQFS